MTRICPQTAATSPACSTTTSASAPSSFHCWSKSSPFCRNTSICKSGDTTDVKTNVSKGHSVLQRLDSECGPCVEDTDDELVPRRSCSNPACCLSTIHLDLLQLHPATTLLTMLTLSEGLPKTMPMTKKRFSNALPRSLSMLLVQKGSPCCLNECLGCPRSRRIS